MANPDQKTILIDNAFEEIKNICINLQKETDASNLEVKSFAIFTTWAFFFDERFHNFIMNIFRIINCSGFNCNGAF